MGAVTSIYFVSLLMHGSLEETSSPMLAVGALSERLAMLWTTIQLARLRQLRATMALGPARHLQDP